MRKSQWLRFVIILACPALPACTTSIANKNMEPVPQERLTARRLDIVDENGKVRMTLAAPTPPPVFAGKTVKRAFDASGLVYYDKNGQERGGIGVADIEGGAAILAADHENFDAIGWRVMPNGEVEFGINQKPPVQRTPDGKSVLPARDATGRIKLSVAEDGTPRIYLADKDGKPRLRLTVTPEGYGAIEFVNAKGQVVSTIAPEKDQAEKPGKKSK